MRRPYVGNPYDAVEMIRHGDPCIQFHHLEMPRNRLPTIRGDVPHRVQSHLAIHDFAEQALPMPYARGDEICATQRVVVALQSNRTTTM
jgi:hypothetical protein